MLKIEKEFSSYLMFDEKGITCKKNVESIYKLPDDTFIVIPASIIKEPIDDELNDKCIAAAERGIEYLRDYISSNFESDSDCLDLYCNASAN